MTTAVDELVEHHFVEVNRVKLHYVEAGAGPLVLFVHGFPEFWYSWRHQLTALAEAGYRVVAVDLRGYNLSEKPAGVSAYRPHELATDLAELLTHLGAPAAAVVCHDFGGPAGWWLAHRFGALLDKLVMMNGPHPRKYLASLMNPAQLLKSWYAGLFQIPAVPEFLLARNDFDIMRRSLRSNRTPRGSLPRSDEERYVEAWKSGSVACMLNYYRATLLDALPIPGRSDPDAAKQQPYEKPVLVIWGDEDRFMTPEQAEQRSEWSPNVTVFHMPDVGHWLNEDAPERVNAALLEFLKK